MWGNKKRPIIATPKEVHNSSATIHPTQISKNQKISFNFHYLNECNGKFCYSGKDKEYILTVLDKLRAFSEYSRYKLDTDKRLCDIIRYHPIKFFEHNVSEKTFWLSVPWADDTAFQFSISTAKWRIHWFWEGNVFHVVWIDPEHNLYAG